MTTPKKPLSKTESAIQLGNILKFAGRGGGGKLRKIGQKPTKSSSKIGEVQTRSKKSLQKQKVTKKDAEQFNEHIAARYAKKAMSEGKKPNHYFLKNKKKKALKNQKVTITAKVKIPKGEKYADPSRPTVRSHPGLGGKIE